MSLFDRTIFRTKAELEANQADGIYCFRNDWFSGVNSGFWIEVIFVYSWFFIAFLYLLVLLHANKIIFINTTAIVSLFYEVENEPGSGTDSKLLLDQLVYSSILSLTMLSIILMLPTITGSAFVLNSIVLLATVLLIPFAVASLFGSYITNYLKGDTESNSTLYAGVFDLATLFGFFKRFLIQFVRYVLVTAKVVLFSVGLGEFLNKSKLWYIFMGRGNSWQWLPFDFKQSVCELLTCVINFFWELTNVFIIYYAQLGAFVIVLFWLLKSLYSVAWPVVSYLWNKKK